ncbi:MAG: triose-phosphate isomerase [Candidatus Omnitrophica bacterium]|nr:triose-phosphate isomerase [Candidatus Omnitrophota bacterium]
MKRRPIVAGNWKMHKTNLEARKLTQAIVKALGKVRGVDVVIAPAFTALETVGKGLEKSSVSLAAQNCHWDPQGAYTGEVSLSMIKALGAEYVIVGHSERRKYFADTDEIVAKKAEAAFRNSLTPIVCIGETLEERDADQTSAVVERQLQIGLGLIPAESAASLIIAYEPVWAIGTGRNATPAQAQEVHAFIRKYLEKKWSKETAENIRIQYGGSVKVENARQLFSQRDVDGFLIGGASLDAVGFSTIVKDVMQLARQNKPKESLCTSSC